MESDGKKLTVLYLPRWYPHRFDPMPGLFVKRHAEAAAMYCNICVVYVQPVEAEQISRDYLVDFAVENGVKTVRVYYRRVTSRIPLLSKALKLFRFYKANHLGIKKIKEKDCRFKIIHVHILTRLGVVGLYYRIFYGIPYMISEHWSRYLERNNTFNGFFRKIVTRKVVAKAGFVTAVTQDLANAMKAHGLKNSNYRILDNVVAEEFYDFKPQLPDDGRQKTFVNVTCFEDRSKNISGLLRVIQSLSGKRDDFVFKLVGDGPDFEEMKNFARSLGLNESTVVFTGLLENGELVSAMGKATAHVVFSNFENLPVVINESLVLGVPVIATKVGGIPEVLDAENGILIEPGDEKSLENTLIGFLENRYSFDREAIRLRARDRYAPATIGKTLYRMYNDLEKSRSGH